MKDDRRIGVKRTDKTVHKAVTAYRIAHELHIPGKEMIPGTISEMAHSQTGIDIHRGMRVMQGRQTEPLVMISP